MSTNLTWVYKLDFKLYLEKAVIGQTERGLFNNI